MGSKESLKEFSEELQELDQRTGVRAVHSMLTAAEETYPELNENLDIARNYLIKRNNQTDLGYMNIRNLDYLAELEEKFYGEVNDRTQDLLDEYRNFDDNFTR